jgi:hypothetical protein
MLLLGVKRDVSIADVERASKEVPTFRDRRVVRYESASLRICRVGQGTVHDAPFTVNQDSIPPMIRPRETIKIQRIARVLQEAMDHFGVKSNRAAHFVYQKCDFLGTAASSL